MKNTKPKLQEDFFEFVNYDWKEKTIIPNDKPATGSFYELDRNIEETEINLFNDFLKSNEYPSELENFLTLYSQALNKKNREQIGYKPLLPLLEKLNKYKSFGDVEKDFRSYVIDGFALPFNLFISEDMKNSKEYVLYASPASHFMPDKKYYYELKENSKPLFDLLKSVIGEALKEFDDNLNINKIVDQALQYDYWLAEFAKSSEEKADYTKSYNKYAFNDFLAKINSLSIASEIEKLIGGKPEFLIVTDPVFFDNISRLIDNDNFDFFKSWVLTKFIFSIAPITTEKLRNIVGKFSLALSGTKELKSFEKQAFSLATSYYSQIIGVYYGKKYLGENARENVHHMIQKMISIYNNRIEKNNWLSSDTKKMAIKKLNALKIHVGYPDVIPEVVYKLIPDGDNYLENVIKFSNILANYHYSKWGKKVEENEWEMSADTVNAYYNPSKNEIVFPAAILQKPFYDINQSSSANFGGIGAVIAHEISHAFDNNGAQFDEYGNLNVWWKPEDYKKFEELGQSMIDLFNDIPFGNGKVNGKLTVSENIADAGGLSCALEAAKQEKEVNLIDFFTNWAKVWRIKSSEQYTDLLLTIDVHAPAKLRANVQAQNLEEFYETFNEIDTESDMFLPKGKRVKIW